MNKGDRNFHQPKRVSRRHFGELISAFLITAPLALVACKPMEKLTPTPTQVKSQTNTSEEMNQALADLNMAQNRRPDCVVGDGGPEAVDKELKALSEGIDTYSPRALPEDAVARAKIQDFRRLKRESLQNRARSISESEDDSGRGLALSDTYLEIARAELKASEAFPLGDPVRLELLSFAECDAVKIVTTTAPKEIERLRSQ